MISNIFWEELSPEVQKWLSELSSNANHILIKNQQPILKIFSIANSSALAELSLSDLLNHIFPSQESPSKKSILLVQNDPIYLPILVEFLKEKYTVYSAVNGRETFQRLENHKIDLVVLDMTNGILSNTEISKRIRQRFPHQHELPIIVASEQSQIDLLMRGGQSGVNDYVRKPIYKEELLTRIDAQIRLKNMVTLQASQQKILQLLDQLDTTFVSFDLDGVIQFCNQQTLSLFGKSPNELLNENVSQILPSWQQQEFFLTLREQTKEFSTTMQKHLTCMVFVISVKGQMTGVQAEYSFHQEQGFILHFGSPQVSLQISDHEQRIDRLESLLEIIPNLPTASAQKRIRQDLSLLKTEPKNPSGESSQPIPKSTEEFRQNLVDLMWIALQHWEKYTQKNKIELIEESKIWSFHIDKYGSYRTRTFDRYFKLRTVPQKPRWKEVLQTAYFVLKACPQESHLNQKLLDAIEKVETQVSH